VPEDVNDRLLTPEEACEVLSISRRTLGRILSEGGLPSIRVRRHIKIRVSDLNRFLAGEQTKTTSIAG
jgi:excisionase family DNA binding protein